MAITRAMEKKALQSGRAHPFVGTSAFVDVPKTKNLPKKSATHKKHTTQTRKRPVEAVRQSLDENIFRPIQPIPQQGPMESNITSHQSKTRSPPFTDIHGVEIRMLGHGGDTDAVIMPVPIQYCDNVTRDFLFGQNTIRIIIKRVRATGAHSPVRRYSTGSRLRHRDNVQLVRPPRTPVPRLQRQGNDQLRMSPRTPVPRLQRQDNDQLRRSPRTHVPRKLYRPTAYYA